MSGPMNILQIIADEIERRAIMASWVFRGRSEYDSIDDLADWPWNMRDDQKDEYRRDVVRALIAAIDREQP